MKKRILCITATIAAVIVLYKFNPVAYGFWPKCPLKLLTGLSCPACGIQRFVHAFTNGKYVEAIRYNYFLVYSLPYALSLVFVNLMPECRFRNNFMRMLEGNIAVRGYVVLFCIWFIVRNILNI